MHGAIAIIMPCPSRCGISPYRTGSQHLHNIVPMTSKLCCCWLEKGISVVKISRYKASELYLRSPKYELPSFLMESKLKLAAPADDRDTLPAFMLYGAVFMPRLLWPPAGLSRLDMRLLSKPRPPKSEKLPRLCGML